ncbi:hypothetical protein Tco_0471262 [Tanacetum coccineum]
MDEPILNENIEKAQTKSNLSITSNNIKIDLNKEFLAELRNNICHETHNEDVVDHIAKVLQMVDLIYGDGKINTWEELVEKFFCRFYPESYDGEDEMLDEGDNWGIDPLEFLSNMNTSFKNHKKVDGRTKKITRRMSDPKKEDEQSQTKRKHSNTSNSIDEQPNKIRCKAEKFEAIQYSLGPNEEYIPIRGYEFDI